MTKSWRDIICRTKRGNIYTRSEEMRSFFVIVKEQALQMGHLLLFFYIDVDTGFEFY